MNDNKIKKCPHCKGTGIIKSLKMDDRGIQCTTCEGTGVPLYDEKFDEIHDLFVSDEQYFKEEE